MQTFYPGVYFKEVEFGGGVRPVTGIDMSIGAIVGYFQKGPIGVATKVTAATYQDIFGGPIADAYGWYALDGFFKNNPNGSVYVVRTVHYTDITDPTSDVSESSTVTLKDRFSVPADTLEITAKTSGAWGDGLSIGITDGHLVNTETLAVVSAASDKAKLKSINNINVGSKLMLDDVIITVSAVDPVAREITFTPTPEAELAVGTKVNSFEFNLLVYNKGTLVETFANLSIENTHDRYVETIINDENSGSAFITVDELGSESDFPDNVPGLTASTKLTGGNDGITGVGDADIIGNKGAKTGIYALDLVQESFNLFCPESCSEDVTRAVYQYCEGRMDAFGIGSVPESYDSTMALQYRLETGNFNTSYGALYYGWGYVSDPIGIGSNPQKLVPLVGHIAGYYGRNDRVNDLGQVPAGEGAVLFGVNKLEFNIDDITNGDLNKVNVNCIRNLSGAGIVIWGARTLSADSQWRYINARRIFIYVEKSVALGTRWAVFKPSNTSTWKSIKRTVESFLNNVPGLFGDSASDRYVVICDETTNPESIRKAGQIVCKIGLAIESVGEFIIFEIGQMSEGVSITE